MSTSPFDFLNLFVRPPGDVIYFLAAVALCQAAFFMALGERWRRGKTSIANRYTVGAFGLLVVWLVVIAGVVFALIAEQSLSSILPPLERAAGLVIIVVCAWSFLPSGDHPLSRRSNQLLLLAVLAISIGYLLSGFQWTGADPQIGFTVSSAGIAWTLAGLAAAVLGLVVIGVNFDQITDAPLKLLFFIILIAGHIIHLIQILQGAVSGDYAGTLRIAFLAALSIIPGLIYRAIIGAFENELRLRERPTVPTAALAARPAQPVEQIESPLAPSIQLPTPPVTPIQRDSIQLLKTLGLILEASSPSEIPERIVKAALEILKADVGAILNVQDANYADVAAAYDLAMRRPISGMSLNLANQPTLGNSIDRRMQRPLYLDRNGEELQDLYNRLDVEETGPTYFQPLVSGKELTGILLIGQPYCKRELDDAERELLKGIGIIAGHLLSLSYAARDSRLRAEERAIQALLEGVPIDEMSDSGVFAARQEMQASLQASRDQIAALTQQIKQLRLELDQERSRVALSLGDTEEGLSVSQRILALTDEQQRLRDEREQLRARLQEAETTLVTAGARGDESIFRGMVDVLRREKEELLAQREALQRELNQMRANQAVTDGGKSLQAFLDQLALDKQRLQSERDEMQLRVQALVSKLRDMGLDDTSGSLPQMLPQIIEQLAALQSRIDQLTLERNALLNERTQFASSIDQEKQRDARIQALEQDVRNLASDREALTKERDQLRAERNDLLAKQDAIKQNRARLVAEASSYQLELAEAHQEQAKLRLQIQQLANEKTEWLRLHDQLVAEKQALETERDMLLNRIEGNRERLQEIGESGLHSLTRMIEDVSEQRSRLERELTETRNLLASAQNKIDLLQAKTAAAENEDGTPGYQLYNPEVTLGAIQELRTPLTSIMGYVDLLMEESAGILGEMQRKFLHRVAANINRMTFMLDDLTRITALDTSKLTLVPQSVDVIGLIEDTISSSIHQFREKSLTVHLNLDESVPPVKVDRDAISQVISQLLTNAYLVSPPDSQIIVTAHRQEVKLSSGPHMTTPTDSILISIEDRGGGIPQDELARVFTRKYKAANPLIPGLGDTGVGLSIAKTLVEAHRGGLWVESRPGTGSIFYVALPVESSSVEAQR